MKPPYWFCTGWWSPWCVLDNLLCRTRLHWDWVCCKHDAALERRMRQDFERAEPVDVTGRPTVMIRTDQTASNSGSGQTFHINWTQP